MLTALEVAKFFLADTNDEEPDFITNLKLQKLLYYTQGYSLVLLGEAMFSDKIEHWAHGPVVTEVYHEYKSYGKKPIPKITLDFNCFTKMHSLVLNKVIAEKGKYTAITLRNMTHKESPWLGTKKNEEITNDKLLSYFSEVVESPFNFDLGRMKDRVEKQKFYDFPSNKIKDVNSFRSWLANPKGEEWA